MTSLLYNTLSSVPDFAGFKKVQNSVKVKASHPDGDPLTNQKISVFAKVWFLNIELGTYETDRHGRFTIEYNWVKLPLQSSQTLVFKVFEETLATKTKIIPTAQERLVFETIRSVPFGSTSLEDLSVSLYEFQENFPLLKLPSDPGKRPQQWNIVDYYRLLKATFSAQVTDRFVKIVQRIWGPLSQKEIEEINNVKSQTLKVAPETTLDLVMNGICPNIKKIGDLLVSEIIWDSYTLKSPKDLPNARLVAREDEEGNLSIQEIVFQVRGDEPKVHKPEDPDFENVLFRFNCLALAMGSSAYHLGTHLEVGQYAIAAGRHLNTNPIKSLIVPHLQGVLEINQQALSVVVDTLSQSALSHEGVWQVLTESLAGRCYTNFNPPQPVCKSHYLAFASNKYWEIVQKNVDDFFENNREGIEKSWYEVYYMSNALVKYSLPYQSWSGREDPNGANFRETYNNRLKAVRPITHFMEKPSDEIQLKQFQDDLENLKRFCAYLIYQGSWGHWVLHINQSVAMDPTFAKLAPESASSKEASEAIQDQITLSKTLARFVDGALVDNPNENIYPPIIEALKDPEVQAAFAKWRYDINRTFYGTII